MIRVYLDWNIFGNLKRENDEPFKSILTIIRNNNNNKLLFPYSPAHLQDLQRGFNKSEKAKLKTYADLNLLQEISKCHCLYIDNKEKDVTPQIFNPTEYFNQLVEDTTLETFDIDNPFKNVENDAVSKLWSSYIDTMKGLPSGINLEQMNNIPDTFGKVKDIFQNLQNGNNFHNLLKDVFRFMKDPSIYSSIYKSIRKASVDNLKINTNSKEWGNAFDYLDKIIAKTKLNKTFRELIDENLKTKNKDKSFLRFDYFINYYISLDTFGYYKDKEIPNLIGDATHAFYGAHCDIFVTEDNNTYYKTKAVYENFNISTAVCKASEFQSVFYSLNDLSSNSPQTISDRIVEIIRYSFILLQSIDDEFNPVAVYKIQYPVVDFFNRMQISYFKEETALFFYKKKDNYSNFMFWTEIENIVNKVVLDFGIDDNLKLEFNGEKEKMEINDKKWDGRIWKRNQINFEIIYNYDDFGLILRVTLFDVKN